MSQDTSVSLDNRSASFVEEQVRAGRYDSADDVLQTSLRLMEDHEVKVRALQDALIEGERSGEPTSFDFEAFIASKQDTDRPA